MGYFITSMCTGGFHDTTLSVLLRTSLSQSWASLGKPEFIGKPHLQWLRPAWGEDLRRPCAPRMGWAPVSVQCCEHRERRNQQRQAGTAARDKARGDLSRFISGDFNWFASSLASAPRPPTRELLVQGCVRILGTHQLTGMLMAPCPGQQQSPTKGFSSLCIHRANRALYITAPSSFEA